MSERALGRTDPEPSAYINLPVSERTQGERTLGCMDPEPSAYINPALSGGVSLLK